MHLPADLKSDRNANRTRNWIAFAQLNGIPPHRSCSQFKGNYRAGSDVSAMRRGTTQTIESAAHCHQIHQRVRGQCRAGNTTSLTSLYVSGAYCLYITRVRISQRYGLAPRIRQEDLVQHDAICEPLFGFGLPRRMQWTRRAQPHMLPLDILDA